MNEIKPEKTITKLDKDQVINKIYVSTDVSKTKSMFDYIRMYVNFALSCLGLILIVISIFLLMTVLNILLSASGQEKNLFEFLPASHYRNIKYYGRSGLYKEIVSNMTRITDVSDQKNLVKIERYINSTSRNYLLTGDAGTGKTQFVKKLVYKLDRNLAKFYKKTDQEYVRAVFVSPAMLLDKYVGQSEKNIRLLFEKARKGKNWKATFIFLDEIDSYFGTRRASDAEHTFTAKTEFLNLMSGISEDLISNIFIIGATNLIDNIDPAFKRRMGRQITFKIPNQDEIIEMLNEITKNWSKLENYDSLLRDSAIILYNLKATQAQITDLCTKILMRFEGKSKDLVKNLYDTLKIAVEKECKIEEIDLGNEELIKEYSFDD